MLLSFVRVTRNLRSPARIVSVMFATVLIG